VFAEAGEGFELAANVVGLVDDFLAASWLFQKVSPVICDSSSAKRWVNLATSKKPPQVGELVGGGRDLRADDVEHRGRIGN